MKNRKPNTPVASSPAQAIAPAEVVAEAAAQPAITPPAVELAVRAPQEATPVLESVAPEPAAPEAAPKKAAKAKKEKKVAVKAPKLVRDRFTMPETEYATLAALKQRARQAGVRTKKSQLLLAGLKALAAFPDSQFLEVVSDLNLQKAASPA